MSSRDFGDIHVSPGLFKEELRRWPWQALSQGWTALAVASKRPSPIEAEMTNSAVARRPVGHAEHFAIAVIFSLVGLDLTLWLLFQGGFAGMAYTDVSGFLPGM